MTNTVFNKAFDLVIGHEGGYVDDKNDPGGETKYGISKRAYPILNIHDLTLEEAKKIYKKDYWDKIKGDALPDGVAVMVFDFAVNAGVSKAIKTLQATAKVRPDGIIGAKTIDAVFDVNPKELLVEYASKRMSHYKSLPTFKRFGNGWLKRTNQTLKFCLANF